MINCFDGKYAFLSNFYNCPITYNGLTYLNNEATFQAQKTIDESIRKEFTLLPPNLAKRKGRKITLRSDWEYIKDKVMYEICLQKFNPYNNEKLLKQLIETGTETIVEGNYWHDNYWGNCSCKKCKSIVGKNMLGKILMKIRNKY
jgi:ribA/ribD-fused uncharacterized protein